MAFRVRWRGLDSDGDPAMVSATVPSAGGPHVMGSLLVFVDEDGDVVLIFPQNYLLDVRHISEEGGQ